MYNTQLIKRLEGMRLSLKKFKSWDGELLMDIADKTKVYIFGLQLDKQDENFRKGVINMIDEYRTKICSRDSENNMSIKYSLENILEWFIPVMELKEEDSETEEEYSWEEKDDSWEEKALEAKENDAPEEWKKSKTKKKKSE